AVAATRRSKVSDSPIDRRPGRPDEAWVAGKKFADCGHVAVLAGREVDPNVLCVPMLDFSFQGTPTREAVVSGDRQESRCELRVWIGASQLAQSILRQFFQILEGRAFGKFRIRHRPFLPLSPGVRVSRAGSQGFRFGEISLVGSTLYADRRPPLRPK